MFRKMRRFKQQISDDACKAVLREEPRGVLAVLGDDEYPYTIPMDFIYDEKDNAVYFHCAKEGHKLDAIAKHDKASFCVMDKGYRKEGEWALNIQSVIVFGRLNIVKDSEQALNKVRDLTYKYYPDAQSAEEEIQKGAAHVVCLKLSIEHMTGKLVNES